MLDFLFGDFHSGLPDIIILKMLAQGVGFYKVPHENAEFGSGNAELRDGGRERCGDMLNDDAMTRRRGDRKKG
jgi:hypothetical protein